MACIKYGTQGSKSDWMIEVGGDGKDDFGSYMATCAEMADRRIYGHVERDGRRRAIEEDFVHSRLVCWQYL